MRCFKTTLQQMLTASWLINKPHKYPWIPKTGIAKKHTSDADGKPDHVDRKRGCCFCQIRSGHSAENHLHTEKGQIHASVMIKIAGQITGKQN